MPLSWGYGTAIAVRNARFDRFAGHRFPLPVLSVGNLTTGGTGKTPMVAWIARQLMESGREPVIAMRGYLSSNGSMSDEQAQYKQLLTDPHVVANPNRVAALREFLSSHRNVNCIVLDDGFQHRQIARDLDLVLIDAMANTFADRLLPAGNLREPVGNLKRADAVIITHAPESATELSNLKSKIERCHGKPPIACCRHRWSELRVFDYEAQFQRKPVDWLRNKRVLTMTGVGNPQAILKQLDRLGAIVAASVPCRDHERFDRAKVEIARGLCSGCDAMLVTMKDWVKLEKLIELSKWPKPIVVPELDIEFFEGEAALRERIRNTVAPPRNERRE